MIFQQIKEQLQSLQLLIGKLSDEQYSANLSYIGGASIGQHTRHILELLACLKTGSANGKVDYFHRTRNLRLENERHFAILFLGGILQWINRPDQELELVTEFPDARSPIRTTFFREIVYHTEHTIHHLALIRVALRELQLDLVDDNFGMAYSTLAYKKTACAQ